VFVGDTGTDAATARAAGVPFVAVSFGFLHAPVETLSPDAVLDRFGDLLPTLRRLPLQPASSR
jgi:phosphoglycolate phosphatase